MTLERQLFYFEERKGLSKIKSFSISHSNIISIDPDAFFGKEVVLINVNLHNASLAEWFDSLPSDRVRFPATSKALRLTTVTYLFVNPYWRGGVGVRRVAIVIRAIDVVSMAKSRRKHHRTNAVGPISDMTWKGIVGMPEKVDY